MVSAAWAFPHRTVRIKNRPKATNTKYRFSDFIFASFSHEIGLSLKGNVFNLQTTIDLPQNASYTLPPPFLFAFHLIFLE